MTAPTDPFRLARFVDAQASVLDRVAAELAAGTKLTHWMWFVFPQLRGPGTSALAERFAIGSLDEARSYPAHPLLGPRLVDFTRLVLAIHRRSARQIFGAPDDLKFGSSMTLFERAAAGDAEAATFAQALDRFCAGRRDAATLVLLDRHGALPESHR